MKCTVNEKSHDTFIQFGISGHVLFSPIREIIIRTNSFLVMEGDRSISFLKRPCKDINVFCSLNI